MLWRLVVHSASRIGLTHALPHVQDDETAVRYEDLEVTAAQQCKRLHLPRHTDTHTSPLPKQREHAIFQLESDVSKATADLRSTEAELAAVLEGTAHTASAAATPARRKRGRAEIGGAAGGAAAGSSQTKLGIEHANSWMRAM